MLVGFAVACVAAAAAAQPAGSVGSVPTVRIVDEAPVMVRGAGFSSFERVRVTITRNGRATARRVRATRRGSFRVGFGLLALDPCVGFIVVRATGARGSRAVQRRPCRGPAP